MFPLADLEWQSLEPYVPLMVGTVAGVIAIALVVAGLRRLRRRRALDFDAGPIENLADYAPAPDPGPHRLTFEGQPVRIRLIVLAPPGRSTELKPSMAEGTLEAILFGLGGVARGDQARIRIWPPQLSQQGFAPAFFRRVLRPEGKDEPSRWILAAGPARVGANVVLLGMALETREPSRRGSVVMKLENWPDRVRIHGIE